MRIRMHMRNMHINIYALVLALALALALVLAHAHSHLHMHNIYTHVVKYMLTLPYHSHCTSKINTEPMADSHVPV